MGGLAVKAGSSGHTISPHPSSREGHHSTPRWSSSFPPIAFAYLVLLNGVAAFILLASLPHFAGQITHPRRMMDAMLVFGIGAAIALGSTFCLCASHRETASSGADSATGLFVVVVCFSRPSGSGMLSDRP